MQCRDPTFDAFAFVRPICASATHWNATEWLGVTFAYDHAHSRPSDMSRVCFWPCDAPTFRLERAVHAPELGVVLGSVLVFLVSRTLSKSRAAWIAIATIAAVCFAFAMLSYLLFARSTDSRFAAWAAAGTVAFAQFLAARAVPFETQWTAGYALGAGALGFAAARALVPTEIDPRAAVALETLLCLGAVALCVWVVPSPFVALAPFAFLSVASTAASWLARSRSAHIPQNRQSPSPLEDRVRALEHALERDRAARAERTKRRRAERVRSKSPSQ